ncbi:MAG TPA: ABC transporter ATP-binding protein [Clostridiaceae bacterium]|jgi:ABC-2 type transport system ATP-binding protein|nr:ABC transporter ATP-binding protein [Clostridiaceae bacterium]
MKCLSVDNVTKRFGDITALSGINLDFYENKIYGLLGRNGAGKSTLLNIITGRLFADEGSVTLDGTPVIENEKNLSRIFMMSENNYYPESMKVSEAFGWTKEFYPSFDMERAYDLSERFGLSPNKKIKSLSTGYSSIFKLITALSTNAPYILLDEPVLGLDANHRDLFYKVLIEVYSENPATFIISTHLIEEVSGIVEGVVVIDAGRIICNESRESLLSRYCCITGAVSAVDAFVQDKKVIASETLGGLKNAYIEGTVVKGSLPEGLNISGIDLQKLFILLTNKGGRKQ